ncbi:1-phosphatidylinositol-4,5-bisphosphate phosphodiesterase gamma 2 [Lophiotrema nucula]|uniref:Phosphoinositide phospholipase C n=1 Tax=Lophiotrema nucula TaxID=690887 RepID=A0A6A5YW23_9PLEO|nr:1-phosphatidylinositol-4,5-bisphosphate phosphodiesterase gamma 2 [Lophiotrema nucula]
MSSLVSGLSKLRLRKTADDDDDVGEEVDANTVAGGGHAARESAVTKDQLRVSHALKMFLIDEGVLSEDEVGLETDHPTLALQGLLNKNHINVPAEVLDRNHPLPDYFISSSHNTYLLAHQLYGTSSATAYETALNTGSRCVEIDAWDGDDNKDEPKVTHGYTLVSNIPFRQVCETLRDVVDLEVQSEHRPSPVIISLENHCDAHGQLRLAQIMREVLGDRLLSKAIRDKGTEEQEGGEHVALSELGSKLVVIVEYHLPNEQENSDSSSSSSEDEEEKQAHQQYKQQKKAAPTTGTIVPELAELGVYAQSVKPVNNSWFESVLENAPHHHLINVSEVGLKAHLPANSAAIARHNSKALMRVFPKGTRISSKNLLPAPFWGIGAQICALNWQTFGASSQLNEALFAGSGGYVLKPAALRGGGSGELNTGHTKKLRLHIAGATDVPVPASRDSDSDIKPYLTCTLVHPSDLSTAPPKRKTAPYKPHKLNLLKRENPPPTDPVWKDVLEWEYEDNELAFLRLLVKSDDSFASNPTFAVGALRLSYVVRNEWVFVRLLDLKGHETRCSVLVKFEIEDV